MPVSCQYNTVNRPSPSLRNNRPRDFRVLGDRQSKYLIGHWEIGGMGEWVRALVKHGQINTRGEKRGAGKLEEQLFN
jgi:hypothetical protein